MQGSDDTQSSYLDEDSQLPELDIVGVAPMEESDTVPQPRRLSRRLQSKRRREDEVAVLLDQLRDSDSEECEEADGEEEDGLAGLSCSPSEEETVDAPPEMIPGLEYLWTNGRVVTHDDRDAAAARFEARQRAMHHGGRATSEREAARAEAGPLGSKEWDDLRRDYPVVEAHHRPAQEPFDLRNGQPYTNVETNLLQMLASDHTLPLEVRVARLVRLLNTMWCKIECGVPKVGFFYLNPEQGQEGDAVLTFMRASDWLAATKTELMFTIPVTNAQYDDNWMNWVKGFFGQSLNAASARRQKRPAAGRPPPPQLHGDVWEGNNPPARSERNAFKQVKVNIRKLWYDNMYARNYFGTYFKPILNDPHSYHHLNLFDGFRWLPEEVSGMARRHPASVKMFLRHIDEVISNGNNILADYATYFVGHLVQRPEVLFEGAPVFIGDEGAGKGAYVKVCEGMLGKKYVTKTARIDDVIGHFNGATCNKMLIFFDEAKRDNGTSAASMLKVFLTEVDVRLKKLYEEPVWVRRYYRSIISSNDRDCVEIGKRSRRFAVFDVSSRRCFDVAYHKQFTDLCLSEEGLMAIYDYFLNHYKLEEKDDMFNHGRTVPRTKLLSELQQSSMNPDNKWLLDCLYRGRHVDPTTLKDAKDPVISGIRRLIIKPAFDRLEEQKALAVAGAGDPEALRQAQTDFDQRRSWVQFVSINQLRASYLAAYRKYHSTGSTMFNPMSHNALMSFLQENIGGRWEIKRLSISGITHLADSHALSEFVRTEFEEPEQVPPPPGQGVLPFAVNNDVRVPMRRTTASNYSTIPATDYYIMLPPLRHCQKTFCDNQGIDQLWEDDQWESAETVLQQLQAASDASNDDSEFRVLANRVLGVLPADELETNGAFYM